MIRRTFAMILSGILLLTTIAVQQVGAQSANDVRSDSQAIEKIRTRVEKIGVGVNARAEIKLRDHNQLKGYISEVSQDGFTVVDNQGSSRTVSYADAATVKKAGSGLSAKSWFTIAAVVAGAAITWVIVKPMLCDGGAQTRGPC